MTKKIIIGILLLGSVAIIGLSIFMANFELFEKPTPKIIKQECDSKGLRKANMYGFGGNAVTQDAIHISISDCNSQDFEKAEYIFTISPFFENRDKIYFEWKNIDTLQIRYTKSSKVFRQKMETENVNPKLVIEYIEE